jgi:hypothetical protein
MKQLFFLIITALLAAPLSAQVLDSLLLDVSIFERLHRTGNYGNRVTIVQPTLIESAMQEQIEQNKSKRIQGFRIRIFSSNAQTARATSQAVREEFESLYPEVPAYPKFENIDYRVLVGNFRTRSEAMRFHRELTRRPQYQGSVIVRDAIEFPAL